MGSFGFEVGGGGGGGGGIFACLPEPIAAAAGVAAGVARVAAVGGEGRALLWDAVRVEAGLGTDLLVAALFCIPGGGGAGFLECLEAGAVGTCWAAAIETGLLVACEELA